MANSVNKRIRTELNRPSAELIGKFKGIPAANIDDAMQRMAAMSSRIRPFAKHEMLGPAFTVKVPYGDNLMLHKAMSIARPGDILVIQCEESTDRAIFGGLMVREMLSEWALQEWSRRNQLPGISRWSGSLPWRHNLCRRRCCNRNTTKRCRRCCCSGKAGSRKRRSHVRSDCKQSS